MIAKVALPLPINTLFDYYIPDGLRKDICRGARVKVSFRNNLAVAYVTGTSSRSSIKNIKPIISLLDKKPILDDSFFAVAEYLSKNYLCSLGEALSAMLPGLLRKGREIGEMRNVECGMRNSKNKGEITLLHDLANKRWDVFKARIGQALEAKRGIIFLSPEINSTLRIKKIIENDFNSTVALLHSQNSEKQELENWLKVKNGLINIAVGTSFAVFAPVNNLGLIIIDEEDNSVYKQEQGPYYNAKDVALYRAKFESADLILASFAPSLESYYLAKKEKYKMVSFLPEEKSSLLVQVADISDEFHKQKKRNIILSNVLENNIRSVLAGNGKVMLFLNRVGFATLAICASCGFVLKCSRCSNNLVSVFADKELICRRCNFKIPLPDTCPECKLSYIRYSGFGTEKLESEIHRLFPGKKIIRYDKTTEAPDFDGQNPDILIATQIIEKDLYKLKNFDLLGVLSLDMMLDRIDFRAAEKAFQVLSRLMSVVRTKAIIQTRMPQHYIIKPIKDNDYISFYNEELAQRNDLALPPFVSLAQIHLRGRSQDAVLQAAESLFTYLNKEKLNKNAEKIEIFEPIVSIPLKLRGNFRYNILLKSKSKKRLIDFLADKLKEFRKSGIIITVDVDPL